MSKIDELIEPGYNKFVTNTKDFMVAIKMLARNMFYISFQPFKEINEMKPEIPDGSRRKIELILKN